MGYCERCGDCGTTITEALKVSKRDRVCGDCWERRGWLVKHGKGLPQDRFGKIQRAMAYKTGTAKRQILRLQAEYPSL